MHLHIAACAHHCEGPRLTCLNSEWLVRQWPPQRFNGPWRVRPPFSAFRWVRPSIDQQHRTTFPRDPGYIAGPGPDTLVIVGGLLEVIVALACIGTGVVLYPVVKQQNEGVALGFVSARILEAGAIFAGVVALMSIVTLRQAGPGEDALSAGQALLAQHAWTTLFGQGLIPAFNALLLGSLMYRSRLLPRILPVFGFIGAPLLIAGAVGMLFGLWGPVSPLAGFGALFLAIWEFGMGIWLVLRDSTPTPSPGSPRQVPARAAGFGDESRRVPPLRQPGRGPAR